LELETGRVFEERFKDVNLDEISALQVYRHDPFTWGSTAAKAVETALALEVVASMARKTLALNPDPIPLQQALIDKHFKRKHGASAYYGQKN